MARFTNSDQTTVQLIQIKSDLQFDRQIKLKSFHQHICGPRKHGLWLVEENDDKHKLLVFERSREKWIGPIQYWSVYAVL